MSAAMGLLRNKRAHIHIDIPTFSFFDLVDADAAAAGASFGGFAESAPALLFLAACAGGALLLLLSLLASGCSARLGGTSEIAACSRLMYSGGNCPDPCLSARFCTHSEPAESDAISVVRTTALSLSLSLSLSPAPG